MMGRQKIVLIVLGAIIVLGILSLFGIVAYRLGKSSQQTITPSPTPEVPLSPTEEIFPSPTLTPPALLPDGTGPVGRDETSLIKQAVFKLTGLNESKAEVTINKNTGKHAKGSIKEYEAVGGAYWIAAKSSLAGWVGVYAGQANPTCEEIAPYNFPNSMVPECLDAGGKVVKR